MTSFQELGSPSPLPWAPPTAAWRTLLASAVGDLDGAPVGPRYHANRMALVHARAVRRARTADDRLTVAGRRDAGERAHRYQSPLRGDRQIIAFDPASADPVSDDFGARVVSAAGAKGHAGYFAAGTASVVNFAGIGVGQPSAVSRARGNARRAVAS